MVHVHLDAPIAIGHHGIPLVAPRQLGDPAAHLPSILGVMENYALSNRKTFHFNRLQ
jgi:hypothetical protein